MIRSFRFVAALAAVAATASLARAQAVMTTPPAITIGAAGGVSIPMGDAADQLKTGYHVQGQIGFHPAAFPISFRGEVGFDKFKGKPEVVGPDASFRFLSGIANAVYDIKMNGMVTPYLIAGVGIYNSQVSVEGGGDSPSTSDFGINGGAGIRFNLSSINSFIEGRYHNVMTEGSSTSFIPVMFGINFGF